MAKEYFPEIGKIKFEGKESKNPMAFHYYDAEKVIMGKPMKDWLRFAMAWWHTLCAEGGDQFGGGTKKFPWNEGADAVTIAKQKADAGFEIMQKLGIPYYCFHDVDLVSEGSSIAEYESNALSFRLRTLSTLVSSWVLRIMYFGVVVKAT